MQLSIIETKEITSAELGKTKTFSFSYWGKVGKARGLTGAALQAFKDDAMKAQTAQGTRLIADAERNGYHLVKGVKTDAESGRSTISATWVKEGPAKVRKASAESIKAKIEELQAKLASVEADAIEA